MVKDSKILGSTPASHEFSEDRKSFIPLPPICPVFVVLSTSWRYLHQIADWRYRSIKSLHHKTLFQDSFTSPQYLTSASSPTSSFPSPFPIFFPTRLDFILPQSSSFCSFLLKYFSNLCLLFMLLQQPGHAFSILLRMSTKYQVN